MREVLFEIIKDLEQQVDRYNTQCLKDDTPRVSQVELTLLGQFSLFADADFSTQVPLIATTDLDAIIKPEWDVIGLLKKVLEKHGLEYDELSSEIWVPPESTFEILYESHLIICKYLAPLYALLCKAIKAPERNRLLIQQALPIYGDQLIALIEKYGGDIEYFLK